MKVLHILHNSFPLICGYSIRSNYILSIQSSFGFDVAAVTSSQQPNYTTCKEIINNIIYWRTAPVVSNNIPIVHEILMMNALKKNIFIGIRDFHPDIIHSHSPILVSLPAYKMAKRYNIPFIYEIRDCWENASVDRGKFKYDSLPYKFARYLDTYVMNQANAVITICQTLKKEIASRSIDENKIHIVDNGVDTDELRSDNHLSDTKYTLNLQGKSVIGYIGAFQPYEGLESLVKSMVNIIKGIPNAHLLIVGGGGVESDLRKHTHDMNLDDHITFTGRIPHEEVARAYAAMDILVYPRIYTRTTALTTPLKPLEAMAMGKPVIVSDVPAMLELVKPGITGFTFKAGDSDDLAKVCINVLNDKDRSKKAAIEARSWVEKERQWSHLVMRYTDIYGSILKKG